jgi:hypothetical protein
MGGAALAFGIDVVELARAADLLDKYGQTVVARVATAPEADWAGDTVERLAALLGLKEAAIKAMAGRPVPFRWQLVRTGLGEIASSMEGIASAPSVPGGVPDPVREVLGTFAADTGLDLAETTAVTCRLAGPAGERISARLAGSGEVLGLGCFGIDDEHLYAAVVLWKDGES